MNAYAITRKNYKGLNPDHFGHECCKSGHFWGPGIRTHWLLHFVVSGTGIFQINGKTYHPCPGQIFVAPPHTQIFYQADLEQPWEYIYIAFEFDGELPVALPDVLSCPQAAHIFDSLKYAFHLQNGRAEYLCSKIWEFFSLLLEGVPEKPDYIRQATNCIHAEYMNNLTVQKIADRLGLDRTYLSSLFKKQLGISPKQYLLRYQMEQAATLLSGRPVSVNIVAASVGYNDIYTFSKAFKRHFGCAPTDYNKKRQVD